MQLRLVVGIAALKACVEACPEQLVHAPTPLPSVRVVVVIIARRLASIAAASSQIRHEELALLVVDVADLTVDQGFRRDIHASAKSNRPLLERLVANEASTVARPHLIGSPPI